MKFTFLYLVALGHSISLLNDIKRHFVMVNHSAQTEPTVIELQPSVLSSQRAEKGDCDVTGRVLKSHYNMNTVFYLK